MFAHPTLDGVVEQLRGGVDVYGALLGARKDQWILNLQPVAVAGQADAAGGIDVAFVLARQFRHQRAGVAGAAEEGGFDAACEFLVDENANIAIALENAGEAEGGSGARGEQFAIDSARVEKMYLAI